MRHRIVRPAAYGIVVAILLFAVPLAIVLRIMIVDQELSELRSIAAQSAAAIDTTYVTDPPELPPTPAATSVAVYDSSGIRRYGHGPATADQAIRQAFGGRLSQTHGGELVVGMPVAGAEHVLAVVRAAESRAIVDRRIALAWGIELLVGLSAVMGGWFVARRMAGRLTASVDNLAASARAVTNGDLGARAPRTGVPELDAVSTAHNTMVGRLAATLQRERDFNRHLTHQLRTPLAALRLELEADPRADTSDTLPLRHVGRLERTIDEMLAAPRRATEDGARIGLEPIRRTLARLESHWHGVLAVEGRRLEIDSADPGPARLRIPGRAVDQVLDVLIDNARRHGRGTIQITVRQLPKAVAIQVADEGRIAPGVDPFAETEGRAHDHGIGLSLARILTDDSGGRLLLTSRAPTAFSIFLATPNPPPDSVG